MSKDTDRRAERLTELPADGLDRLHRAGVLGGVEQPAQRALGSGQLLHDRRLRGARQAGAPLHDTDGRHKTGPTSAHRQLRTPLLGGSARSRKPTGIRIARSRSSSGYFLGAAMTLILAWLESLYQTRHETDRQSTGPRLVILSSANRRTSAPPTASGSDTANGTFLLVISVD